MKKHLARILAMAMTLGLLTTAPLAADSYGPLTITQYPDTDNARTIQFEAATRETTSVKFYSYYAEMEGLPAHSTEEIDLITLKPGSTVSVTDPNGEPTIGGGYGYTLEDGYHCDVEALYFDFGSGAVEDVFILNSETQETLSLLQLPISYDEVADKQTYAYLTLGGGSTPVPAAPTTKTGETVAPWAKELVDQAIDASLMPGHLKGADLNQNITRTQFADLAVTLYEAMSGQSVTVPSENPFTDTADEAVLKAYAMGFTSGVSDTEFGSGQPLTREAAATMLAAVYKKMGGTVTSEGATAFADDAAISSWARDNVYFMAQNGIIAGVGDNTFDSQSMAQSQAALIMALRMFQNLK